MSDTLLHSDIEYIIGNIYVRKRNTPFMLNYIWFFLIVAGVIFGAINGKMEDVSTAAIDSASSAVTLSIGMAGAMMMWAGLMRIAEKSGLTQRIARIMTPLMNRLFPEAKHNPNAMGAIVMNLSANFLGVGNAATPLGIKAMEQLDTINRHQKRASNAMCMLVVLNASMIQLIPTNLLAIRSALGSENPGQIIAPVWITSGLMTVFGIVMVKLFQRFWVKQ